MSNPLDWFGTLTFAIALVIYGRRAFYHLKRKWWAVGAAAAMVTLTLLRTAMLRYLSESGVSRADDNILFKVLSDDWAFAFAGAGLTIASIAAWIQETRLGRRYFSLEIVVAHQREQIKKLKAELAARTATGETTSETTQNP